MPPALEPRPPAGDGQQGDVDPAGHVGHLVEQLGVPGEIDARPPGGDLIAGRGDVGPELEASSLVRRPRPGDLEPVDPEPLAGGQLGDVGEAPPSYGAAGVAGDDDRGRAIDPPEGREVEMIVVQMRDQDRVDAVRDVRRGDGWVAVDHLEHPPAQDGIREDPLAAELHEDRPVAHVGDPPAAHVSAGSGRRA